MIALMKAVAENGLTDFTYEENGVVLKFKKHPDKGTIVPAELIQVQSQPEILAEPDVNVTATGNSRFDAADGSVVTSPLVGTFYSAASPDSVPYVQVGDTVQKGQVLGIVEAMKLMNEIESDFDGVVKKILVKNGDVIEYGQPMFVIG